MKKEETPSFSLFFGAITSNTVWSVGVSRSTLGNTCVGVGSVIPTSCMESGDLILSDSKEWSSQGPISKYIE